MKLSIIALILPLLSSCTVHPFAYNPTTGEMTSLGASVGTRSTDESAYAYTPSGTPMGYHIVGKDETVLGKAYFWERGITAVSGNILNGFRSAQATDRIISSHGVQKAGIKAVRDVRLAEIAVPPEVPVVPVVPVPVP